ncbi:MAG: LysR family transcriptional regulator [Pseudomonadota bacterium]|jgi:DNA-binding transcriptional LysR family regulator
MTINLPMEALRSFAAIVEHGSMVKAADHVYLSQSALSLQIKRLEEVLGRPLFLREGKRLALSPAGGTFLVFAQRMLTLNDEAVAAVAEFGEDAPIRVGLAQDFVDGPIAVALAAFQDLQSDASLKVQVGFSSALFASLKRGELDLALGFGDGAGADEAPLRVDALTWIGRQDLPTREVLPLAMLESPCLFRDAAIAALDKAGRPWRIAMETRDLSNLRAAVQAGVGLTCRTPFWSDLHTLDRTAALPRLPAVATWLAARPDAPRNAEKLAGLIRTAFASTSRSAEA